MRKVVLFFLIFPRLCLAQTELVRNGAFTTNLASWTQSGNVKYGNFYSNGCALFSGGNTAVTGIISQNITVDAGETLSVTLNYGRRGQPGAFVGGLFEIINNSTSTTISSTTLTAPNAAGVFISTSFTLVAPSSSLLLRFTDQTSNGNSRDFYLNTVSITQPNALPIELIGFNVTLLESESRVLLNWETASEINNDYFTIERSSNGSEWDKISEVDGAGNSSISLSYSLYDESPLFGRSYYRLKQTDFDGKYSYSNVKAVQITNEINNTNQPKLYPNPTNRYLIVENYKVKNENFLELKNTTGIDVSPKVSFNVINESTLILDLNSLESGFYILKINSSAYSIIKE